MIEKNLYDLIISQDSRRTRYPLNERKRYYRIPAKRKQQTIKVVERLLNRTRSNFNADFLSQYEQKLKSVAENKVSDFPSVNESIFLNLGRVKFVDKLLQAYYLFTRHPELWSKLLVDNEKFFSEVQSQLGQTRKNESLTESEEVFLQVVDRLSIIGPRALGGRDSKSTLKGLRFSVKRPERAKEIQFRRGYRDKGSLAPQHLVEVRKISSKYYDELVESSFLTRSILTCFTVEGFAWAPHKSRYSFRINRKSGFDWDEDEVLSELRKLREIEDAFIQWCSDNSLDEEKVAKDFDRLLRQG